LPTSVDPVPIRRWIRDTPSKTGPATSDQAAILDMMITRAQGRIDTQLRDAETRAARSLGVLAIDAAAVALLVGVHTDLSRFWPVPTIALGIAGLGLLWVVWPAKLDSGPDTRAFFETFGGGFELTTKQQMLADLLAAVDRNDLDSRLRTRDRIFRWSFILLVVSLIGSLAVAMTGPALQFP
jgi:hypothetical protein